MNPAAARPRKLMRQLRSTILHFDYDCFYASVFESEHPHLKTLPLAVQQKQIIVTCNYEARRRGLYKLQLVTEALKVCPDVVIVLGEDLTRFRNASKELYAFLSSYSWNARCERLGFDEVFMDVSDMIEYNASILNPNNLGNSFFHLSKGDPTLGFAFDATRLAGHTFPEMTTASSAGGASPDRLQLRLLLASHLALHMRSKLASEKGYTATVGISTNKVLAKLVGTLKKPDGQTTLLPPYTSADPGNLDDNVTLFMDDHEIAKVPGIGFKIGQKLRAHVLQRPADFDTGLVYGGTKERVLVRHVRQYPGMGPEILERLLGGAGAPHAIGDRIWELLNGCDSTEVAYARDVPTQISIEDSYLRLDTLSAVIKELHMLATSLIQRMHTDLLEDEDLSDDVREDDTTASSLATKRWLAQPRTIRLSTRPRPPQNPDGSRNRSFARISRSAPMPSFVFSLKHSSEAIVERLVDETLLPLFRRLHPEKSGWNLRLVNVAAANMADTAREKGGMGRDIGKMFRRQDETLKHWRVEETPEETHKQARGTNVIRTDLPHRTEQLQVSSYSIANTSGTGSEDLLTCSQQMDEHLDHVWHSDDSCDEHMSDAASYRCERCDSTMPLFAMFAHERYHKSLERQ